MVSTLKFQSISSLLISIAIIVMIGLGLVIPKVAGYSALLILLISLLGLWVTRKDNLLPLEKWEKWWIGAILLYFGLIVLDVFFGYGGVRDLDSPSRLILAIPVYIYIRRVGLDINIILIASAVGAITSGIYSGYQYEILGMSRATGMTSPIYFGQTALVFALFSLVGFFLNKKIWLKSLLFIAVVMGLYTVITSGSRSAWSALLIITFVLFITKKEISFSKKFISLLVLTSILYVAYQFPQSPIKSRIGTSVNSIISYYQEGKVDTSSGARLELWKAAWIMAKENNFLGVGEAQFQSHVIKLIQEEKVKKFVGRFEIPHNQYLNSLSEQGAIGFMSLLLMMFIPLKVSLYNARSSTKNRLIATFLVILITAYLSFMLTIATLERESMVVFYAFLVSMLMGALTHNKQQAANE